MATRFICPFLAVGLVPEAGAERAGDLAASLASEPVLRLRNCTRQMGEVELGVLSRKQLQGQPEHILILALQRS